jgi:hypothetical protein
MLSLLPSFLPACLPGHRIVFTFCHVAEKNKEQLLKNGYYVS